MFGNLSRRNRALVAVLFLVASASAESVGTFLQASFTDTVSVTSGQQSELVRVSGEIFILTDVNAPVSSCTPAAVCASVPIAMLRVAVGSGVGQTSGNKYIAVNASAVQGTFGMPGSFVSPIVFDLFSSNGTNTKPATLQAVVTVNAHGTVTQIALPPVGLVSWWKAEGNAADAMGANPGTIQGPVNFVTGKVGEAFAFTGAGSVNVPASRSLQPTAVTSMAWVKNLGSPGADNYILSQGADACTAASYALYTATEGVGFYVFGGVNFEESPLATPAQVWDGNWHLVAGTYDGATVRLYVDGAEVTPGTATTVTINYALPNQNFYIGAYQGSCQFGFAGDIDEVRIFNRALSAGEIHDVFTAAQGIHF
jgi:hypothetical protein